MSVEEQLTMRRLRLPSRFETRKAARRFWHNAFGHGHREENQVEDSSWEGHTLWCYSCGRNYFQPVA